MTSMMFHQNSNGICISFRWKLDIKQAYVSCYSAEKKSIVLGLTNSKFKEISLTWQTWNPYKIFIQKTSLTKMKVSKSGIGRWKIHCCITHDDMTLNCRFTFYPVGTLLIQKFFSILFTLHDLSLISESTRNRPQIHLLCQYFCTSHQRNEDCENPCEICSCYHHL